MTQDPTDGTIIYRSNPLRTNEEDGHEKDDEAQGMAESFLTLSIYPPGSSTNDGGDEDADDNGSDGWSTVKTSSSSRPDRDKKRNQHKKEGEGHPATPVQTVTESKSSPSPSSLPPNSLPIFPKRMGDVVELVPPTVTNMAFTPFIVLLVGLPGSGKSTFASALEHAMPYKFCRVNQDQLKTRVKCEKLVQQILSGPAVSRAADGRGTNTSPSSSSLDAAVVRKCPIIDRCNFDFKQRSTWYNLAAVHNVPIDVVVLDVPTNECIRRVQQRQYHETLPPSKAASVITQVHTQWRLPFSKDESKQYRSCTVLKYGDDQAMQDCWIRLLNQME